MINSDLFENPDRILTGFGVLLAAISVLYFGRETILDLSPLVKSFLLVAASTVFILSSFYIKESGPKVLTYILSTTSYLTFLIYFIGRMSPSSETIFLLLGLSGALFIFAGRKIGKTDYKKSDLKKAIIGIVIIVAAVVALDTVASEPVQTVQFDNSVEVGEAPVNIGFVRINNDYLLPQVYSVDDLDVCRDQREFRLRPVDFSERDGVISGSSSKNIQYEISRISREEDISTQSFQVEIVDECGDTDNSTIQIIEGQRSGGVEIVD